ncbi:MAG: hypothetical protein IPK05_02875 [Comamonadaceae bacterium]|nr:hypothetical protein [Comamonadaceae bacterium]
MIEVHLALHAGFSRRFDVAFDLRQPRVDAPCADQPARYHPMKTGIR